MKIAVLLATFNRRDKTIACLHALHKQELPEGTTLDIFLTDDNSADGTAEYVKKFFPNVHLFHGNGYLYWAGGMRATWKNAIRYHPDFYLLVNDDTILYRHAVQALLDVVMKEGNCICAGNTRDDKTGSVSYGGSRLRHRQRWGGQRVFSKTETIDCDFANANIMLVPAAVVEQTGILAEHFTHSLADYDYCLRAKKQGFAVKLAAGFLGSCIDDHGKNWKDANTSFSERLQYLKSPKGIAYKEYMHFIGEHFPLSYPAEFAKLWGKTFFPFIWDQFKK